MEDSYQVRTCTSFLPSLVPRISSSLTLHGYKVVLTSWSLPCRCFIAYAASDQTMMFRTSLASHTLRRERKGMVWSRRNHRVVTTAETWCDQSDPRFS